MQEFIKILVAEDNDVSRDMIVRVLETQNYRVYPARDGSEAIHIVEHDSPFDVAIIDINMSPMSGFELLNEMVKKGYRIPTLIVSASDSSDLLVKAADYGVRQVIQKPVDPQRLIQAVHRMLKQQGINPMPVGTRSFKSTYEPIELMDKAIELAKTNVERDKGGPFAAILSDYDGKIIGRGASGHASRVDPMAHAEVMAIRQAAETLGTSDLSACVLYVTSEPTAIGKALIRSVGIEKVYYGLNHEEVASLRMGAHPKHEIKDPEYIQMSRDAVAQLVTGAV